MNVKYRRNKLEKQLSSASEIKKSFGANAKRVSSRMDDIQSSPNLTVLIQIPAARCHQLTGDRRSEWALNVSANDRLIFEISHDPVPLNRDGSINTNLVTDICILEIVDYH
jgi:proteic killer suppression protein